VTEDRKRPRRPVLRPTLPDRYYAKFHEMPATMAWMGSVRGLDKLMREAIRTGRKLTLRRLYAVQGMKPPSPGVDLGGDAPTPGEPGAWG
jgi:hypothetical protein